MTGPIIALVLARLRRRGSTAADLDRGRRGRRGADRDRVRHRAHRRGRHRPLGRSTAPAPTVRSSGSRSFATRPTATTTADQAADAAIAAAPRLASPQPPVRGRAHPRAAGPRDARLRAGRRASTTRRRWSRCRRAAARAVRRRPAAARRSCSRRRNPTSTSRRRPARPPTCGSTIVGRGLIDPAVPFGDLDQRGPFGERDDRRRRLPDRPREPGRPPRRRRRALSPTHPALRRHRPDVRLDGTGRRRARSTRGRPVRSATPSTA